LLSIHQSSEAAFTCSKLRRFDVGIPGVQQGELGSLHLSSAPTLGFSMEILNKKGA